MLCQVIMLHYLRLVQLEECVLWEHVVASSSLAAETNTIIARGDAFACVSPRRRLSQVAEAEKRA